MAAVVAGAEKIQRETDREILLAVGGHVPRLLCGMVFFHCRYNSVFSGVFVSPIRREKRKFEERTTHRRRKGKHNTMTECG